MNRAKGFITELTQIFLKPTIKQNGSSKNKKQKSNKEDLEEEK
jgi:hypothetical protein